MSNAIVAAHAAYELAGNDAEWLEQLLETLGPLLNTGRGVVGFRWSRREDGSIAARELEFIGGRPGDEEMFRGLLNNLDETRSSLAYEAPYSFKSLSEIAQDHPTLNDLKRDQDMQRLAHDRDLVDFEMLRVDESSGRGWMFSVLRSEVNGIAEPRRQLWQKVGAHIAAGVRLRATLDGPELDEATAVFDPNTGTLEVGDEALKSGGRRERLLELIEARREAEERVEYDPLGAMDLWEGLVAGRWSLLDTVDTDGRTYTVLRENPLHVRSRVALSERERQVAYLVGRGHHVKLAAYELGLAPSTVRSQLSSAMRKLNVEDRAGLYRLVASVDGPESATPVEMSQREEPAVDMLALADGPLEVPASLSPAEAEVARLVFDGQSNREIAETRGTSERTVANQLRSIYRKLEVSSREELVRALVG